LSDLGIPGVGPEGQSLHDKLGINAVGWKPPAAPARSRRLDGSVKDGVENP
jgi:hypothetical protein